MPSVRSRTLVRGRGEGEARVTPFELFFDLVFVFAVTQLSHRLLEQLTISGAAETFLLLLAVWLAWTYTTWVANWFDPDQLAVRLMLVAVMLASLAMSASIPDAFGDRGLGFAGAFVAIHVGRTLFVLTALDRDNALTAHFRRVLCWTLMSAPLWLAGAFAERDVRIALWLVAVVLDLTAPMFGFRVPGLGRDRTRDLRIEGGHLAHRYYLFVILALGESILVIGATFSQLPVSGSRIAAFVIAFLGSVALWEIYFARSEAGGHRAMTATDDAARLGHWAYIAFHLPLVAGVIAIAAGDEQTIAHPTDPATAATAALILGGSALYLIGSALFSWALEKRVAWSRLAGLGALTVLAPLSAVASVLVLSIVAVSVVVGVAFWDVARPATESPSPRHGDGALGSTGRGLDAGPSGGQERA